MFAARYLFVAGVVFSTSLFGCASSTDTQDTEAAGEETPESAAEQALTLKKTVTLKSMAFSPARVSVKVGTTVTFKNTSHVAHTVTSGAGSSEGSAGQLFDAVVAPGASFKFTFKTAGTQAYFCRPHESMGMVGVITVTP